MRNLWAKVTWPVWMRDEWEGEAGVALAAACRSYDETKGSFARWLWVKCYKRVGELIRHVRRRGRRQTTVSIENQPVAAPAAPVVADAVYRRAKLLDAEVVVERYENKNPLGNRLRLRHTKLMRKLREEL